MVKLKSNFKFKDIVEIKVCSHLSLSGMSKFLHTSTIINVTYCCIANEFF